MKKKLKYLPIVMFILIFLFFGVHGQMSYNKFYESDLNHLVVERNNWQKRATEFYLENGVQIDSFSKPSFMYDLKINDSIVKMKNSDVFYVYRKNHYNKYECIHVYKYKN